MNQHFPTKPVNSFTLRPPELLVLLAEFVVTMISGLVTSDLMEEVTSNATVNWMLSLCGLGGIPVH